MTNNISLYFYKEKDLYKNTTTMVESKLYNLYNYVAILYK